MGEVLPDECLDEDGEVYTSNAASNMENAKADSERWNNLLHGPADGETKKSEGHKSDTVQAAAAQAKKLERKRCMSRS